MAEFKTHIENPEASKKLRGLDLQSLEIACSPARRAKFCQFVHQYIRPELLEVADSEGEPHRYAYRRFSAVGSQGSLVHVRLHEQTVGEVVDPELSHVAVISHLDDPNDPVFYHMQDTRPYGYDGLDESIFKAVGSVEQPTLQLVGEDYSQVDLDIGRAVSGELGLSVLPTISITGRRWLYERSDRHLETLSEIDGVRNRVALATLRGLTTSAAVLTALRQGGNSGQFDQKMVV